MKTTAIRFFLFLLVILALACKRDNPAPASSPPPESHPALNAHPTSEPGKHGESLTVTDSSEKTVLSVVTSGDSVTIEYVDASGTHQMTGSGRDSGKRKYDSGSGAVAEVKPGDDGFKVRTADGKLLWKVKFKEQKIKVSDNEENNNPFVLSLKHAPRVEVLDAAEHPLGELRIDGSTTVLRDASGAERFRVKTSKTSAASAIMLVDRIPLAQRSIIAGELYARGK